MQFLTNTIKGVLRKGHNVERYYLNANEVAEALGVKIGLAYKLIRQWNQELQEQGKLVIRGKVNKQYFLKKMEA